MTMIEIPITFHSDEKGYFDRECPNEGCLFTFKVNLDDWRDNFSDEEVFCPKCGHAATSNEWFTQAQLDEIQKRAGDWAMSHVQGELDKSFKKIARRSSRNKFVKVTYKPGRRVTFTNNPVGQSPEWEQDISCANCGSRYSVIGTAYFCPCCGRNTINETFFASLDNINSMVESLPDMESLLESSYGKDKAASMCESMIEGSLRDIVSVFQKFAEQRYKTLSSKTVKVNDFQIVEKGSKLFEDLVQKPYSTWLSQKELFDMNLMFQKRHLIEHNGGIVDDMYIKKSGDHSYKVDQRLIVKTSDTKDLIAIIRKLGHGLSKL